MKPSLFAPTALVTLALCAWPGAAQTQHQPHQRAARANSAQAQAALPQDVLKALRRVGIPASAISVMVQALPLEVGASPASARKAPPPLLEHRADASVNPASVMKLFTTYAALDVLGPDFTWKNRVYIDGTVQAGTLNGNLILRGSGDPKLVQERLEDLFKQIQAKGIREIRGDIVLDRRVFDVPDKNPAAFDDEPLRPYNVAPDGFLVNFKSLILTFSPDASGKRVLLRVEPPMMHLEFAAEVTASYGPCGDWRANLQADFTHPDHISFLGRYALSCGERVWPVAYVAPKQFASRVIEAMWRASGGQLSGSVRDDGLPASARLLLTAESLPLASIIADVNKYSNNVMAQQVFLSLSAYGAGLAGSGSFAASQKALALWWSRRLPQAANPIVENGSGLSRIERSSAAALNALLQLAASSPNAQVFANSLAIAGVDGTAARMRERNPNSSIIGHAQIKTGTLKDVAAVAGYVNAADGRRYSLAAIVNHDNASAARPALDALLEWVAQAR